MKTNTIIPILSATLAAALFLAGCTKEDARPDGGDPGTQGGDIRFEIGFAPQTRMATGADFKSAWEDGDEIGIYAVKHGQPLAASDNSIHNVKLTYNKADDTWSGPVYWPTAAGDIRKLDFYAYYPYDANAADPTGIAFRVATDQNDATGGKDNYTLSDLLTAKGDKNGEGFGKGETVQLTFSHALAMVQVSVPLPGKGSGPGESLTLTLRSVKTKASLDLRAVDPSTPGSGITLATDDNAPADIAMYRVEQPDDANYRTSYTYRALVPAQELTRGKELFRFEHESRQLFGDAPLASALTLEGGRAETFTRELSAAVHTVAVPKGMFQMGSPDTDTGADVNEKPRYWVKLTRDFYLSKYEVTRTQYAAFLNATGVPKADVGQSAKAEVDGVEQNLFKVNEKGWTPQWNDATGKWEATGDYPMIHVTWYGAKAYAEWVGGRLPTEAEWEYACRAGTETIYSFGDDASLLGDYAVYWDNTIGDAPSEVGTKKANLWGLYDMHGNVYEWCLDSWDGNANYPTAATEADAVIDPLVTTGPDRVGRGGSWLDPVWFCRSACRNFGSPGDSYNFVGFRVAFP